MKMDVSKFKKVSSDKKKTVLKHPRGHEIVIAHNSVSPSTRKQLHALPAYAEGGDVDDGDSSRGGWEGFKKDVSSALQEIQGPQGVAPGQTDADFASRYNAPPGGGNKYTATVPPLGAKQQEYKDDISQYPVPGDQQDVAPSAEAPAPEMPAANEMGDRTPAEAAPLPTQEEPPIAAIESSGINPMDQQAAAQDKTDAQNYRKGYDDYYKENAQYLGHEDAAWQHDLQNGHVTPLTYHDLYAKRDTLGKVGMLFGLLVGGAGAGLAHQSNAVLDGMNKEIENDYNAQLQSKGNAQNFLKLHQQEALNKAQIKLQEKQGTLTEAQAKAETAQADINAQAATLMKMNRTALHDLTLQVQKMPAGPQRSQAEAALAMVSSSVDAKNFNIADVAAGKAALAKMLGEGGMSNTTLLKTIPGMEGVAKDIEEKTIPGVGRAQIPVPQETRDRVTALQQYDQKAKEYVDFAKQHSNNWANLNPIQRQQIANQGAAMGANLQSLYRNKIKGGVYKKGEQEFIQQIIPDNPAKWSASFNAIPKVQQTIQDNSNDLQTTSKSVGLPQSKQAPAETQQVSKSGRPMIQKNGKWYYAK